MKTFETYINWKPADFVADPDFINWVLAPDGRADQFWNAVLKNHPTQAENIEKARKIILAMKVIPEDRMTSTEVDRTWTTIEKQIGGRSGRVMNMGRWLAAASILLVLTTGYFLIWKPISNDKVSTPVAFQTKNEGDLLPGGNRAILTLADGSSINLDDVKNGNIASQNGAHVVKLADGRIVYQTADGTEAAAPQMNAVSTPRGGQYQLTLSDGTKVWLNAESSIRFPAVFTGDQRDVSVTGEAYFEVAHNADMPFHVSANKVDITVLGTHFNVNAYGDGDRVKTSLLQGSVQVKGGNEDALLKPGQQAVYSLASNRLRVNSNVDTDGIVSWKNGKFTFDNTDIHSLMNQIARWYDVEVEYKGNISKTFEGTISRDIKAADMFRILEATGGVHFTIEGRKIIVSP